VCVSRIVRLSRCAAARARRAAPSPQGERSVSARALASARRAASQRTDLGAEHVEVVTHLDARAEAAALKVVAPRAEHERDGAERRRVERALAEQRAEVARGAPRGLGARGGHEDVRVERVVDRAAQQRLGGRRSSGARETRQ